MKDKYSAHAKNRKFERIIGYYAYNDAGAYQERAKQQVTPEEGKFRKIAKITYHSDEERTEFETFKPSQLENKAKTE